MVLRANTVSRQLGELGFTLIDQSRKREGVFVTNGGPRGSGEVSVHVDIDALGARCDLANELVEELGKLGYIVKDRRSEGTAILHVYEPTTKIEPTAAEPLPRKEILTVLAVVHTPPFMAKVLLRAQKVGSDDVEWLIYSSSRPDLPSVYPEFHMALRDMQFDVYDAALQAVAEAFNAKVEVEEIIRQLVTAEGDPRGALDEACMDRRVIDHQLEQALVTRNFQHAGLRIEALERENRQLEAQLKEANGAIFALRHNFRQLEQSYVKGQVVRLPEDALDVIVSKVRVERTDETRKRAVDAYLRTCVVKLTALEIRPTEGQQYWSGS